MNIQNDIKSQREPICSRRLPRVPGDIHLLPRTDDTLILGLAVIVGLWAGLADTLFRVMLRLVGIFLVDPRAAFTLIWDPHSPERDRLAEAIAATPWRLELVVIASVVGFPFLIYGIYR